jgi:hypothetical protein
LSVKRLDERFASSHRPLLQPTCHRKVAESAPRRRGSATMAADPSARRRPIATARHRTGRDEPPAMEIDSGKKLAVQGSCIQQESES